MYGKYENTQGITIHIRTDNTMGKRKRTKGHSKIYKTLHIKLMIEQHNNTTKESSFLESV
jgi:hypothetical protein